MVMVIRVDFDSEEALYLQVRNQIIMGIATSQLREGENLPSVRELAETIGINMHTVNKAYGILKQEGYLKVDRRSGAVVAIAVDEMKAREEMMRELQVILAKACCKGISEEEAHEMVSLIYEKYR